MSDVSFIRATPATLPIPERRTVEAPQAASDTPQAPAETRVEPVEIASKTKVKTEQRSAFSFTYTFIDAKSGEVVGRYPVATLPLDAAPGVAIKHKL